MFKKTAVQKKIKDSKIDAMLFISRQNRFWYTKFDTSLGYLIVTKNKSFLFLDGRYINAGRDFKKMSNVDEIIEFGPIYNMVNSLIQKEGITKLGIESNYLTYNDYLKYDEKLKTTLVPVDTSNMRMIKDQHEIDKIKTACDITDDMFRDVEFEIESGMTETEISHYVTKSFLDNGADKASFETIVVSGVRSALPHGIPTDKEIKEGEFVTIDAGCFYHGYASDITRTFIVGKPSSEKMSQVYDIVRKAQDAGIAAIKPGVKAGDIHKICFEYIEANGFGPYFTHATGHGIGIEVHEAPAISSNEEVILEAGMVVTVEPGIYIPDFGGVRIEDDILVTEKGHEILSNSSRELVKIK